MKTHETMKCRDCGTVDDMPYQWPVADDYVSPPGSWGVWCERCGGTMYGLHDARLETPKAPPVP